MFVEMHTVRSDPPRIPAFAGTKVSGSYAKEYGGAAAVLVSTTTFIHILCSCPSTPFCVCAHTHAYA